MAYKYYCQIPASLLFEKPPQTEIRIDERPEPLLVREEPDLILLCEDCGSLVPFKREDSHTEYHKKLDVLTSYLTRY